MKSILLTYSTSFQLIHFGDWVFAMISKQYHKTKDEIEIEILQIKKAQENPREFGPIYDQYYDEIFIYISKRVEDLDMVADITSKTFTKCLTNIHKFRYMGVPFSAWLYRIAINEVRQFFRARKRFPRTVSISESDLKEFSHEAIDESRHEEALELLPRLLSTLGEKELQCIELRFFEKKSFKEMGFMLGLTEVNAKVKTYRILKKLRRVATAS